MAPAETLSALYEPSLCHLFMATQLCRLYGTPSTSNHRMQARVYVPDERYNWLCDLYKPKSTVAAYLDIVDIAGLVKYITL